MTKGSRAPRSGSPRLRRMKCWATGSPDGEWLVFSRRGDEGTQGLWLRNPGGVNLFQLTSENDLAPVWSPDGDAIAFVRNVDGNRDIYLLLPEDDDDWRGPVKATPADSLGRGGPLTGLGAGRRHAGVRVGEGRQRRDLRHRDRHRRPCPAPDDQRSRGLAAGLVSGRQADCVRFGMCTGKPRYS